MTAGWIKNQPDADKRQALMIITDDGGTPADPAIDFIALGGLFVLGANAPLADLATGTLANVTRPLVVADFAITATDTVADTTTFAAHGLYTTDGPLRPTTTAGGFVAGTDYFPIRVDADTIKWATSLADAKAGTFMDITADVTGMVFQDVDGVTERGIPGHFVYTATQAETDHNVPETNLIVDCAGYERRNGAGAHTSVAMSDVGDGEYEIEAGITRDDYRRLELRTMVAKCSKVGNVFVWRDVADTKDSHSGTVTASGRIVINIIDAS